MAPEQLLSAHQATHQADIYGLGAVLYRVVTGRYVFHGLEGTELAKAKIMQQSPRLSLSRWDSTALGFRDVVQKALQRDPKDRYASADEVRRDLMAIRNKEHTRRPSIGALGRSYLPNLAAAAIYIALAVGCVLGFGATKMISMLRTGSTSTMAGGPTLLTSTPHAATSAGNPLALSPGGGAIP
jgi:serine/threonine protein kinase